MSMPLLSRNGWTLDGLAALPDDGNRYEIIDGELFVTPTPTMRHQMIVSDLFRILDAYVCELGQELFGSPIGVPFSERTYIEPDMTVVPRVNGKRPVAFSDAGVLTLAVEVLSPSTARRDRTVKRVMYQKNNVPEYWIVDIDARTIEVWRPTDTQPHVCRERLVWQPSPSHPPLEIDVNAFFAALD